MASVASAVSFLKQQESLLDPSAIDQVFAAHGHRWRRRELPPATTMELYLRQIVAGNVPCAEVRALREGAFTASAYCQARQRLPVSAVCELTRHITSGLRESLPGLGEDLPQGQTCATGEAHGRWRGHRTFHVDGTGFSMPDTPELQEAFGQPGMQKPGCGFPVAHLLVLFDAATGMILEAHPAPLRTHDLRDIESLHAHLASGDVLIGDTAFSSWAHLMVLREEGMHGVFPLHQRRTIGGARGDGDDGACFDRLEQWPKPRSCPVWMDGQAYARLPQNLTVRVIRQRVSRGRALRPLTVTLVTTLLDRDTYPAEEIVRLAAGRWEAETNLRHLKVTLNLKVLRCRSLEGVLKELAVIVLVYNLVRAVMLKAACRQETHAGRVGFADALRFIRWSRVDAKLYDLIVNPHRPGRFEPRVIKRRTSRYPKMQHPRAKLRKRLLKQGDMR